MNTKELHRLSKTDLVSGFVDVEDCDQPIGSLALASLPERFFRLVVDQHNSKIRHYLDHLPEGWRELRTGLERLLIPTFEDFQQRLADKIKREQVAAHHRKIRDFEVYRSWVLEEQPIRGAFQATFMQRRFPGFIPQKYRRRHCFVVGRSGSGKSETLKLLAIAAKTATGIVRRDCSFVLIDPHGDLAEQVVRQRHYSADFRKTPEDPDLIYLDPFLGAGDGRFPTLNPLDVGNRTNFQIEKIAQQLTGVLRSLVTRGDLSLTLNMETLLIPCITVLLRRPDSTLYDLLRFMHDDGNEDLVELGRNSSENPGHRFFFRESFHDMRFRLTKAALSTKVQSLLNNQAFASFLARPRSTFDLEKALNRGKSLVVNCAVGKLGGQTAEALGRFLVGMILSIALNRAETGKRFRTPIWMVIDEAQSFVSDEIKVILTEARKYALHLTLATQVVGQDMSPHLSRVVLGNTAVKVLGDAGADSQAAMAKEMHVGRDYLTNLEVGEFVVKCGTAPPLKMRMRADYLGNQNQMKAEDWEALRAFQVSRYYHRQDVAPVEATLPGAPDGNSIEPGQLQEEIAELLPPRFQPAERPKFDDTNPFADLED